ncbi:hypothetical protein [Streptosporangium roseum]|uniref:Uncharacterized protein n=1 Tax=Streptosporangium roseum (strain ATCC 12428 / DSM 43021 / JCM 3005 / KCTC 9067 / NCIMB 10171 / NRRL 2505 / NI 9100) TaxID=479432 RepID=D2B3D2_STRRD|nr:hypothetical protein [Streptosporangium roseum]ACZ87448.1 hypothetical protein Sros_4586 [Streptosporangium roseum DSM 43021]
MLADRRAGLEVFDRTGPAPAPGVVVRPIEITALAALQTMTDYVGKPAGTGTGTDWPPAS